MNIEIRVTLTWEPPDPSDLAEAFLEEAAGNVDSLTGENDGTYSLADQSVTVSDTDIPSEALRVTFETSLTYDRDEGKFASREDLAEQIVSEWESMDFEHDGVTWTVETVEVIDRKAERAAAKQTA